MSCLTNNQLINDSSLGDKIDKKNTILPIKKSKKSYKQLMAEMTKSKDDPNEKDTKKINSGLGGGNFSKIDKI